MGHLLAKYESKCLLLNAGMYPEFKMRGEKGRYTKEMCLFSSFFRPRKINLSWKCV